MKFEYLQGHQQPNQLNIYNNVEQQVNDQFFNLDQGKLLGKRQRDNGSNESTNPTSDEADDD